MESMNIIIAFAGFMMPVLGGILLFLMKQISELKKSIASLCERIAKEETRSKIFHPKDK